VTGLTPLSNHSALKTDKASVVQEAGWVPGSVWTGGGQRKSLSRTGFRTPNRPARSKLLHRLHNPTAPLQLPMVGIDIWITMSRFGDSGSTVVKVLCYKSEGRWFDSR
jgi:hypothetical protein